MKDLGTLSYFLGLEGTLSSNGYYLSQAKYVFDLLSSFMLIKMLTRQVIRLIDALSQVSVSC